MPGSFMRLKTGNLPFEPGYRCRDQGFTKAHASIVDEVAGREIVTAVGDEIIICNEPIDIFGPQPISESFNLYFGIDGQKARLSTGYLSVSDISCAVNDLPLKIGQLDRIVVDDA